MDIITVHDKLTRLPLFYLVQFYGRNFSVSELGRGHVIRNVL